MKDKGENKSGYYSSHGAMVPMGPAFTTDGSQYLGRPRRPNYQGSAGQPSMSADSGLSSVDGIARVNRGYEDEIHSEPMFPDQNPEEDEDLYFLRTRKLPIYPRSSRKQSGAKHRSRYKKLNPLKEGFIPDFVADAAKSLGLSAPGIDALIGKMILDREAASGNLAIEEMCRIVGLDPTIIATAMIDVDDSQMINVIQNICNLDMEDRLAARTKFREFLKSLKDAVVTLVQAYDSVFTLIAGQLGPQAATPEEVATIPAVNFVSGISGFFIRTLPIERLIFNLSSKLAQMFTGVMEISEHIESVSPKYGEAMGRLESGFGPVFSAVRQKPGLSLSRLGSLYAALDGDTSLCRVETLPLTDEAAVEVEEELSSTPAVTTIDDLSDPAEDTFPADEPVIMSGLDDEESLFPEAENCACPISELRFRVLENSYNRIMRNLDMSESTLRMFIKEMMLESKDKEKEDVEEVDMPSRYGGPGYLAVDIPPLAQEYIDEDQEEREDVADQYAVTYKGDLGYAGYSARPERTLPGGLAEQALRRIIREEAKKLLSGEDDSKKKDEEEQEEAVTVAGMGSGMGPVTPLGTGPDGGKKTSMTPSDDGARERSIYANERGYGGGQRSSSWLAYPKMGY